MPWSFCLKDEDASTLYSGSWMLEIKLKGILTKLGIDAGTALARRDQVKPDDIKALFPRRKAKAAAWFEVGWMTMFVCNMAGTDVPLNLLDAALSGFDSTLRALCPAEIGQVNRIIQRIKLLSEGSVAKEDQLSSSWEVFGHWPIQRHQRCSSHTEAQIRVLWILLLLLLKVCR